MPAYLIVLLVLVVWGLAAAGFAWYVGGAARLGGDYPTSDERHADQAVKLETATRKSPERVMVPTARNTED